MKTRVPHYLKLLCATTSSLLMIDAASAGSDAPEDVPFDPESNYENVIDAELANYNLLKVSTDDDIFFTPAFVDAFSYFKFGGDDNDFGSRLDDLYDLLDIGQIAREVAAMRDLFDMGIAFFDILDESPFAGSGDGGYFDDILSQPTESTRGTSPPVGFGFGGIASWGNTAPGYALVRFEGSERTSSNKSNDGSSYDNFVGSDASGRSTGRTRTGPDGELDYTIILEHDRDGTRREIYVNHRTQEEETLTEYPDGGSLAVYRSDEGSVWVSKSPDGHVSKSVTYQDENGEEVTVTTEDTPPAETDTTGNPGDEPTAEEREFADWLFGQHALGRHTPGGSVTNPNRVNPGEPNDTGNAAPKLNPGISIVINPDLNASAGRDRELSAELGKAIQQQLSEKVGGEVNPVGPND